MSARFWSGRQTKSLVSAPRSRRLGVERLETREVPATLLATRFDDPFFFPADGLSLHQTISRADANPGPDTIAL